MDSELFEKLKVEYCDCNATEYLIRYFFKIKYTVLRNILRI